MVAQEPDDDPGTSWAPFGSYAADDLPPLEPLPDLDDDGSVLTALSGLSELDAEPLADLPDAGAPIMLPGLPELDAEPADLPDPDGDGPARLGPAWARPIESELREPARRAKQRDAQSARPAAEDGWRDAPPPRGTAVEERDAPPSQRSASRRKADTDKPASQAGGVALLLAIVSLWAGFVVSIVALVIALSSSGARRSGTATAAVWIALVALAWHALVGVSGSLFDR